MRSGTKVHEINDIDRKGGMIVITEEKIDVFSHPLTKRGSMIDQSQKLEEGSLLARRFNAYPD